MNKTLLPPNASREEKAQEEATARIDEVSVVGINALWNPNTCPSELLPWLAWTMSIEEWNGNWSEEQKRNSIRSSYRVHVKKGTVGSIRRILKAAGYGDVDILEQLSSAFYNNKIKYDDTYFYGNKETHWAMYRVYMKRPITSLEAREIRRMLGKTAPARCHLAGLHYKEGSAYTTASFSTTKKLI